MITAQAQRALRNLKKTSTPLSLTPQSCQAEHWSDGSHVYRSPLRLCGLKTLFFLLIVLATSCKTTQRTSGTSLSTGSSTIDSTFSSDTFTVGDWTYQSLTTTITREKPTVVLVNGQEQVVTETTTETQTAVLSTQKDSTRTRIDATLQATKDTTAYLDTLNRATEGMEVIPDIVEGVSKGFFDAIFGKTGKFIVSLILLVIFVILLRVVLKKKKVE